MAPAPPPAAVPAPAPPAGGAPPPAGYPPGTLPGAAYPAPYPYPGYPPPPPGYAYPGYPYQPYPSAYYPYPPQGPRPGAHEHDGFFLRFHLGFGASSFKTDNAGSSIEVSGGGGDFALALGGALTPHLVIYGELAGISTTNNPTLKLDGESRSSGSGSMGLSSIGPGAAYFFGDSNYYLSGSLSLAWLNFSSALNISRTKDSSDTGIALRALFGKEWWVSDNWGLGAAVALTLASMKDEYLVLNNGNGDTPSWSAFSFSLLFSATYN
jgi:hypothetical protein